MQKQIIRIPREVREIHKRLIALASSLPKELPADIEIKTSTATISDLDLGTWHVEHIKLGWPGYRVEVHLRKYIDDRRMIEHIKIRKSDPSQTTNYDEHALKKHNVDGWKV
jgi:hypothetical protein